MIAGPARGVDAVFTILGQTVRMIDIHADGRAELIESIHQPWKATVGECLQRWRALDPLTRGQSYLVVQEGASRQRTLNAGKIAELAARFG